MIPSALSDDAEVARPSLGVVSPFDAVALGADLADGGVDFVLRRAEPFVDVRVDCGVPGMGLPAIFHVALATDSAGVGGAEPAQYAVLVRRRPATDMVEVAAVGFLLLGEDEGSDETGTTGGRALSLEDAMLGFVSAHWRGLAMCIAAVTVALAILCALFLAVALAKFLRGEPGSEVVFLRIGVAMFGGVAFLALLTKVFGF